MTNFVNRDSAEITYVDADADITYINAAAAVNYVCPKADIKLILDSTTAGIVYVDTRLHDSVLLTERLTFSISMQIFDSILVTDLTPRYFGDLLNESTFNSYSILPDTEPASDEQVQIS
jgi:hypothetical protein